MSHRILLSVRTCLASVVMAVCVPHVSPAQWQKLTALPGLGNVVYFLDQFGAPKIGFVGCGGAIVRTSDAGLTWQTVRITTGNSIRDITFRDALNGVAIGYDLPVVYITNDGGVTWTSSPAPSPGTTIHYAAGSGLLFINSPGVVPASSSNNWGVTWSATNVPSGQNGLCFADGMVGIFSAHVSGPLYRTINGGQSWRASTFNKHIYSPVAIAGLSPGSFIGLSEVDNTCWISQDSGMTWTLRSTFPMVAVPTGCLQSVNGHLWAQSNLGMFLSNDYGATWTSLCGPHRGVDARFYTIDSTIYAADDLWNLWMLPDGTRPPPASVLSFSSNRIPIAAPRCGEADTPITLFSAACFDVLDSAYCTGSSKIVVIYPPLPVPLSGSNNVLLRYTPDATHNFDTAVLHLVWGLSGQTHDTTITVYARVAGTPLTAAFSSVRASLPKACMQLDTLLTVRSITCDTLYVLGLYLSDSSTLHLAVPQLPATMLPQGTFQFHLKTSPHDTGTFQSMLHLVIRSPRGIQDTAFPITISVSDIVHPFAQSMRVFPRNLCDWIDTVLWVYNPHCKQIEIERVRSNDTSITVLDSVGPIPIPASDSVPIHLRIQPGHGVTIGLLSFSFIADSIRMDTTTYVVVQTQKSIIPTPLLTPAPLRFGLTSSCSEKALMLRLFNDKCMDVKLLGIHWSIADTQFWFDPISLPLTMIPGVSDTILFHYKPALVKPSTATITLSFELAGQQRDTTLFVTGTGSDMGVAMLSQTILNYPTIPKCDSVLDTTMFENVSCDTMVISSLRDWEQNGYSIVRPTPPVTLAPGDSIPIVVKLVRTSDGPANDSIDIGYASTKPPHFPLNLRLSLFGNIQTTLEAPVIRPMNLTGILLPPCSELDTMIEIVNPNRCDSISITSAQPSGPAVRIKTPLPIGLRAGDSARLMIHVSPTSDTTTASLSISGTQFQLTIPISIVSSYGTTLSYSPATIPLFSAARCSVATDTVTISAIGCDSAEIDSIAIEPANSKFQLTLRDTPPFKLKGRAPIAITYNPSSTGSDSAMLVLHSKDGKLNVRLPLQGGTFPLPVFHYALRSEAGALTEQAAAGSTANVVIQATDTIADSLGMTDVTCQLTFNNDVLTLQTITPGPHFTLADSAWTLGLLKLHLRRIDHAPIVAGAALATVGYFIAVSDTLSSLVALTALRLNPQDSSYERCVLNADSAPPPVIVAVAPSCTRDPLSNLMAGREMLQVIAVRPTLISNDEETVWLDLNCAVSSTIRIRLLNTLGSEIARTTWPASAGKSSIPVAITGLPSGLLVLDISDGMTTIRRKVMIAR